MTRISLLLLAALCLLQSCAQQQPAKTPARKIHSKAFQWSIIIPENFERVSAEQWAQIQDKGADAIAKTVDAPVDARPQTIFVFRSGQMNYFESNSQPFDTLKDGSYEENCRLINDIIYQTFITQLPGIKADTAGSTEQVDGLVFRVFDIKVQYPNNITLYAKMYSRLFGKREFSANIMYTDQDKGKAMLEAWRASSFHDQGH